MRGRRPSGPEYVEQLHGSSSAKERAKVVLETIAGTCRVQEACQRLGISEPRFEQLRTRMLQAAVDRLEPRAAGRPARQLSPAEQRIRTLEAEVAALHLNVTIAQVKEEIALTLPNVVRGPQDTGSDDNHAETGTIDPEKKTRRRHKNRRRPRVRARSPASRTST
jgi:hypothetical protein